MTSFPKCRNWSVLPLCMMGWLFRCFCYCFRVALVCGFHWGSSWPRRTLICCSTLHCQTNWLWEYSLKNHPGFPSKQHNSLLNDLTKSGHPETRRVLTCQLTSLGRRAFWNLRESMSYMRPVLHTMYPTWFLAWNKWCLTMLRCYFLHASTDFQHISTNKRN